MKIAPEWKPLVLDAQGRAVGDQVDIKRVATLMVRTTTYVYIHALYVVMFVI